MISIFGGLKKVGQCLPTRMSLDGLLLRAHCSPKKRFKKILQPNFQTNYIWPTTLSERTNASNDFIDGLVLRLALNWCNFGLNHNRNFGFFRTTNKNSGLSSDLVFASNFNIEAIQCIEYTFETKMFDPVKKIIQTNKEREWRGV